MEKPSVSIILPNYNHAHYLEERLLSIINQSYQDFELIILDDASTDDSLTILETYLNHPKVSHFIANDFNSGSPFKQWKKGLDLAIGDYIWIAESDDSCKLDFLEKQVQVLSSSDVTVAQTKIIRGYNLTNDYLEHPAFSTGNPITLDVTQFVNCPITNISAVVFKKIDRKTLQNSTFCDYKLIGDLVFYSEFFIGLKIINNTNAFSYFRRLGLSSIENKNLKYFNRYFDEHVRFIKSLNSKREEKNHLKIKAYIRRRFNKIRNRKSRREKISLLYFWIYLKYKYYMFIS